MELKEFIGQALVGLIQGVLDAQNSLGVNGKYINPQLATQQGVLEKNGKIVSRDGELVQSVEFDVAVTATEGKGTKGGIGVVVGNFTLGSQGQSSAEISAVSRIKFSVPVALPYDGGNVIVDQR
ncbi:hypothetical protein [Methylomonas sp. ZR1]|uniref:hypothetical protein n=1 Tax=Methylomonas sp. ZR1 TaxID=1797072 RepID=UPI0014926870|nr:hypothetical protein [Methylomonas sp. ZR1]NOV32583.1 hypothetical protein [Methylomonas sp. ZR1]